MPSSIDAAGMCPADAARSRALRAYFISLERPTIILCRRNVIWARGEGGAGMLGGSIGEDEVRETSPRFVRARPGYRDRGKLFRSDDILPGRYLPV